MKLYRAIGLTGTVVLALVLGACNGSSSGGGGAGLVGTYKVTGTATVTAPGADAAETFESVVVVESNGDVTVDPDIPNSFTGTLTGNTIAATIPAERLNAPTIGVSCSGTIDVAAMVSEGAINEGNISGNGLTCNSQALDLAGSFSGPKVATPGAGGREDQPMLGSIRWVVHAVFGP